MTCAEIGELLKVAPLTCTDIGEFVKVAASAIAAITALLGALLAWRKANQIIGLRRAELDYLKGKPSAS
jgi:hypothetical protein